MNYKEILSAYNFNYVRTLCLKCNGGKHLDVYKSVNNPKVEIIIHAAGNLFRIKRLGITKFTGNLNQLNEQISKL